MKHTGHGALALLMLALASFSTLAQDQPEQKPGFFRQLGDCLKDAGQRMVGAKPRSGPHAKAGPLHTPIRGAGRINGLYKSEDHQQAQGQRRAEHRWLGTG